MGCRKIKQLMEFVSENYYIAPHNAEEYFMALVSVGLSLNNEMRKDITLIYNQNPLAYSKNIKNYAGSDHVLLNSGDLDQEIYAKKTLGILLGAEKSEVIKVKVLRLIKKHYRDIYICAQNNDSHRFRGKLSQRKDSGNGFKLTEIWIVLYFYTTRLINANLVGLEAAENAVHLASLFYNVNPINADIPSELKSEDRLDKIKGIVQKELGSIKNPSDILYNKNKEIKDIVSCLRNLLMIDKIDLDCIASQVNPDDLHKVMLAFLKTTTDSDFDGTQVLRLFVTGYIVKMLLNEYLRVRGLYLTNNEENLCSEIEELKGKLEAALSARDNAENQVQKLTNEISDYELKQKNALAEQSMVYEAQISKQNREIERLKTDLNNEMKNKWELSQLRELFFNLENDYLPQAAPLDLSKVIADKKLLIIGGTSDWRKRLKDKYPAILTMDGFNDKVEFKSLAGIDFVLFYSGYMSHSTYYKTVDFIRANDIPAGYIGKTNIDLVEFEIAEELNKKLTAH